MSANEPPVFNRFRNRLRLMAEFGLSPILRVKEDVSYIVQQTLLAAHRDYAAYRGQTEAELFAWLKAILVHKLLNAARRNRTQKNDALREQTMFDRLDQTVSQICEHLGRPPDAVAGLLKRGLKKLPTSLRSDSE